MSIKLVRPALAVSALVVLAACASDDDTIFAPTPQPILGKDGTVISTGVVRPDVDTDGDGLFDLDDDDDDGDGILDIDDDDDDGDGILDIDEED